MKSSKIRVHRGGGRGRAVAGDERGTDMDNVNEQMIERLTSAGADALREE